MKKKFTASLLSEGNHLFQASITVTDDGLQMKIPNFWKDKETFFQYGDISGFRVDTPSWYTVLNYCTIHLNARGTWVQAHGFTKSDAQKIKRYIEEGQNGNYGNSSANFNKSLGTDSSYNEPWGFTPSEIRRIELGRDKILELIEKIKRVLRNDLRNFYLFSHLDDRKKVEEYHDRIKNTKILLIKYLKKVGEEDRFKSILEECRESARTEVDKDIAKINVQKEENAKFLEDFRQSILDSDDKEETQSNFERQIKNLIRAYDSLDVDLLEDCGKVEENWMLVDTFIGKIIYKDYRKELIQSSLWSNLLNDKYTETLYDLYEIILDIFGSIIYKQVDETTGRKSFPYALDYQNIIDYLKNEDNSLCDRMSKLIDVTDNFIDRISKSIE